MIDRWHKKLKESRLIGCPAGPELDEIIALDPRPVTVSSTFYNHKLEETEV